MTNVAEEQKLAEPKKRQPNCPYCGKPLTICLSRHEQMVWEWSDFGKQYVMVDGGDVDTPFCASCKREDWGFWELLDD